MTTKQINGIQNFDNNPFLSNNQIISHTPDKFILDFIGGCTQFSPNSEPTIIINHKVILLDTYMAKCFLETLKTNIEKYEKTYGKIKKPKQLIKAEKKSKALQGQIDSSGTDKPSYTG